MNVQSMIQSLTRINMLGCLHCIHVDWQKGYCSYSNGSCKPDLRSIIFKHDTSIQKELF
jgi:hypothetical protein